MAGIRVSTSVKKIEVNDNSDYITLNFSDSSLPDRFSVMLENIQNRAGDVEAQAAEIEEKSGENKHAIVRQQFALYRQFHEDIMGEIDALFGPGTCRKVFGDIVPDFDAIQSFLTQLIPYFEEYSKAISKKLSKYSAGRTGNV